MSVISNRSRHRENSGENDTSFPCSYFSEIYTNLLSQKILVPMDAEISGMREDAKAQNHFAAPTGISSVVKHLFANSRASLRFQHHVNSVELDTKTKKWIVSTQVRPNCWNWKVTDPKWLPLFPF